MAKLKLKNYPEIINSLFSKRKYWWLGGGVVVLAVVAGQLMYPYERSLPLARIGDVDVSNRSYQQVIDLAREHYADIPLSLDIPGINSIETSTAQAGITPRYSDAAQAVTHYSLKARLVPFSFVYKLFVNRVNIGHDIEQERFAGFAREVAEKCRIAPKDAELGFAAGEVILKSAVEGQECSEGDIRQALETVSLTKERAAAQIKTIKLQPTRTDQKMREQLMTAQAVVERGLVVGSPDKQWTVTDEELAGWLTVDQADDGSLSLELNSKKTAAYLKKLDSDLVRQPGTTTITYLDGLEVKRDIGTPGRVVDEKITLERIESVLFGDDVSTVAWVQLTDVPPVVRAVHTYSKTSKGVQALVAQWDREHRGRYGIIVRDLSGRNLNGSLNADMDFLTASTYKMFLAYATFNYVESGKASLSTRTSTGLSVQGCIDEMILHSTNECATALMDLVGWSRVHHFIKRQFPSTSLDNGASADGEKHTTVRDEVTFLQRLNSHNLEMNSSHHDYLLGLMKRQIYRDGIPAGIPGTAVANKVGFYAGYKHDVAIIYGPKGTYLLGILSYGGADWEFADLSRKVAGLMNR